jgi:hypothetical protein
MYICRPNQGYQYADVMELVDMLDLGSSASRRAGSIPVIRTRVKSRYHSGFFSFSMFNTNT